MSIALTDPGVLAQHRRGRRRMRTPRLLAATSVAVAVVLLIPVVFLLVDAGQIGGTSISQILFRELTASLLWNTVRLAVVTTLFCAIIGTAAAWWIERTTLPGRRAWAGVLQAAAAAGDAGVLVRAAPGLLDLLRNPDAEDDRSDLQLSYG